MRLQGKVAVITGIGYGMGRAMAILFAAEGARIVGGDWDEKALNETVNTVRKQGGEIIGVGGNIAVQADAEGLVDTAVNDYGRLDVLCNNAGVMDMMQGIGELTDDVWRRVISINLDGPMYTSRRAVPVMLDQKSGSIVNIASTAGLSGGPAGAVYTVSKHGVVGLTRSTAWMYATRGIRCNAICPGGTNTNIGASFDREKVDPAGAERTGLFAGIIPGFLEPEDIANLALFLASDESRNINGAIITADAGWKATWKRIYHKSHFTTIAGILDCGKPQFGTGGARALMILFCSMLNEKQRRWDAWLCRSNCSRC